jgi:hypothetical protein
MFWVIILLAFAAIFLLSWIGGVLDNRGMHIGPRDGNSFIPGLHTHHDDHPGGH